jgi:hypothetical protein
VQVDPIKPTLKAPESQRLKLGHEKTLSNLTDEFNLRRYTVVEAVDCVVDFVPQNLKRSGRAVAGLFDLVEKAMAVAYTRPLFSST